MNTQKFTAGLVIFLAACGGAETLTLPADPVDRAATCGIVAAAEARVATADVQAPLPLEAQGRVIHYALLAASQGGEFEPETANSVSRRTAELQDRVTSGKWQALAPACAGAFPAASRTDVELPSARFEAQIACEELADFAGTALAAQETDYGNELAAWRQMRRTLNDALASGLTARAGSSLEAQRKARREALAAAADLGSPVAVLERCGQRFSRP